MRFQCCVVISLIVASCCAAPVELKPPPVCKECAVPDAAICKTLTDPHQCEILAPQCPCACICCQQGQVPPTWCHQTEEASSPFSFAVNVTSDPSDSWLSYAFFDSGGKVITQMNATVTVPTNPERANGADPSFWYGLQTNAGDGALVQPILAWNQRDTGFGVFHEVFDWSEGRDHQSPEHFAVKPGDVLTQSVTYKTSDNSYDMLIFSKDLQKSVVWNYKLNARQKAQETTAYIVVEHQPSNCKEYPASGGITFSDIYIEVEGHPVENPTFVAKQQKTACNSKAVIVDAKTVDLKWTV